MAKQIRSKIQNIAAAIKTHLMTELDLPSVRVIWWARNKIENNQGDKTLFLRLRRMADLGDGWDGAGTTDTRVARILDIGIRSRFETDKTSDEKWMFHDDHGYFVLEADVLTAMVSFLPMDSAGNALTAQPISLVGAQEASKFPDALQWGEGMLSFRIVHELDLNLDQ